MREWKGKAREKERGKFTDIRIHHLKWPGNNARKSVNTTKTDYKLVPTACVLSLDPYHATFFDFWFEPRLLTLRSGRSTLPPDEGILQFRVTRLHLRVKWFWLIVFHPTWNLLPRVVHLRNAAGDGCSRSRKKVSELTVIPRRVIDLFCPSIDIPSFLFNFFRSQHWWTGVWAREIRVCVCGECSWSDRVFEGRGGGLRVVFADFCSPNFSRIHSLHFTWLVTNVTLSRSTTSMYNYSSISQYS